jgi:hypothetical protein
MNTPRANELDEQVGAAYCDLTTNFCDPSQFILYLHLINTMYNFTAATVPVDRTIWEGNLSSSSNGQILRDFGAIDPTKYKVVYRKRPKAGEQHFTLKETSTDQKLVLCYGIHSDDPRVAAKNEHVNVTGASCGKSSAAASQSGDESSGEASPGTMGSSPVENELVATRAKVLAKLGSLLDDWQAAPGVTMWTTAGTPASTLSLLQDLVSAMLLAERKRQESDDRLPEGQTAPSEDLTGGYFLRLKCNYNYGYDVRLYDTLDSDQFENFKMGTAGLFLADDECLSARKENFYDTFFAADERKTDEKYAGTPHQFLHHQVPERRSITTGNLPDIWRWIHDFPPDSTVADDTIADAASHIVDQLTPLMKMEEEGTLSQRTITCPLLAPKHHGVTIADVWLCGMMERVDWQAVIDYFLSLEDKKYCYFTPEKVDDARSKPEACTVVDIKFNTRSVGDMISFLGDIVWYEHSFSRTPRTSNNPITLDYCDVGYASSAHDCDGGYLFRTIDGDQPARVSVSYRGQAYGIADYSKQDHSLQVLSILNQLLNLNKSATELRPTPSVEVLP